MNAAKAKKNPAKVKGAVLIMILAVMTVLIILLAGSIAVVYSAHNRTELKYRENQAYYTARSLVEEFVDSMMNDTSVKTTYKEVYYEKNEVTGLIERKEEFLDVAGALEFDLYKVPVSTDTNEFLGDGVTPNPNYNKWYAEQVAGMTAAEKAEFEASVNFTSSDCDSADYAAYTDYYNQYFSKDWDNSTCEKGKDDTLVYEITSSYLKNYGSDGTHTYGNVFSGDSTSVPPIKVEVLERRFDMDPNESLSIGERIRNGKREKDHYVIKVSAEITGNSNDMPVTTSLIIGTKYNPKPSNEFAVSATGSIETQASLRAVGGMSSLYPNWTKITNGSKTAGNVYFKGSFYNDSTGFDVTLQDNEIFFVKDVLRIGKEFNFNSNMKSANFYAGITEMADNKPLGNTNTKVNLITQKFQVRNGAYQSQVYGNIFADEFVLTNGGNSNGADIATAGAENKIHGNVYCNYLAIPDTNVTILYDKSTVPYKAWIRLDHYDRSGSWGHYTYTTSGDSASWSGGSLIPNNEAFFDYFDGDVNIYRGIKIICAGANGIISDSSDDISYGANVDAAGNTFDKVLGHKYDSSYSGTDYLDFGAQITGPDGNYYTLTLDTSASPSTYKQATGVMDLRYERYDPVDNPGGDPTTTVIIGGTPVTLDNKLETNFKRKIKLPEKLFDSTNNSTPQGKDEIDLPTERSIFGNYFFDYVGTDPVTGVDGYHSDIDYDGNEVKNWTDTVGYHNGSKNHTAPGAPGVVGGYWGGNTWTKDGAFDLNVTTPPVDFANETTRTEYIKSRIIPAEVLLGDSFNYSLAQYSSDAPTGVSDGSIAGIPSGATVITGNGILPENPGGTIYIDATTTSLELQVGKGDGSVTSDLYMKGEYIIVGDNAVSILVPGRGKNNEKVYFGGSDKGYRQWTDPLRTATDIRIKGASPATPAPNVTYYVGHNVEEVLCQNGGSLETLFCGTIFAPHSKVIFDTNMNANNTDRVTYYGETGNVGKMTDTVRSYVYGNIFCARYKGGQHAGVTFIPEDEGSKPGTKKLDFSGFGGAAGTR